LTSPSPHDVAIEHASHDQLKRLCQWQAQQLDRLLQPPLHSCPACATRNRTIAALQARLEAANA
jgi:aminoglycoside phosphotransferase